MTYAFAALKGMSRMEDCREDKRDKLDKNLNSEHSSRKRRFETRLVFRACRRLNAIVLLPVGLTEAQNRKSKSSKKTWPNTSFHYFNTKVAYLNFKLDENKNKLLLRVTGFVFRFLVI